MYLIHTCLNGDLVMMVMGKMSFHMLMIKDREKGASSDMARSEDRDNALDDNIYGDTKGLQEVKYLVKAALSQDNIDNLKSKAKGKL